MKGTARILVTLAVVAAAGVAGYWLGQHGMPLPARGVTTQAASPAARGPIIYYQDPDGKPLYSAESKTTPDGRAYRAVRASEDVGFEDAVAPAADETKRQAGKRILYYRNPMGLPDISNAPKKDSMGMDYIPVYEGEDEDGTTVTLSPGKVQRTGVTSEAAAPRVIAEPVRAPGSIQLDERRIAVVTVRTESFIDSVENVTTGSGVRKGQPLMRLYSPAIASAAAEYLALFRGGTGVSPGTRQRLLNLAVPPELLDEIERTREVPLTFTWRATRDGIVLERNAVEGMRAMPGDVLFRLADHSVVWANVDVAERDLAAVAQGQPVMVTARSYPGKRFIGTVALIYPHLNPATRTVRVRIELPNPELLLRPDMYAEAVIDTGSAAPALAVPQSAVLDSGERQVVIVDKGEGRFEPRPVTLGRRGAGYVELRSGVSEGERVVTSATFLIDAESNLKAALKALSDPGAKP